MTPIATFKENVAMMGFIRTEEKTYKQEEAINAATKWFGDGLSAETWVRKYALRNLEGNLV